MPEFKLPTVKLRGFRDITTDDIKQAISEVPRPDIKLAEMVEAATAATQAAAKAAQDAAAAAQSAAQDVAERTPIVQRRRSRRPLIVVGMVVAGLGLVALANADRIRARVAELSQRARERIEAERVSGALEPMMSDEDAYTGSVGIPIQSDAYADARPPMIEQPAMQPAGSVPPSNYPAASTAEGQAQSRPEISSDQLRR